MARQKANAKNGYYDFKEAAAADDYGRICVLYGQESYLVHQCRNLMKKRILKGGAEDFNYHRFFQDSWDIDLFREAVDAIPLMGDRSLIEVTDINIFSDKVKKSDREELAEIFADLPDYCTILFVFDGIEWKPDKRQKKLYTAMQAVMKEFSIDRQSDSNLIRWMQATAKAGQKTMGNDVCQLLIRQTGGSMSAIDTEMQKLIAYTDQPAITKNDILAVVTPILEAEVFTITDLIGRRDYDAAILLIQNLLRQDIEPISINAIIGRQFRQMYGAKLLSEHGKGAYDMSGMFGISSYSAENIYSQARSFRKQQLKDGMRLCAETDMKMKSFSGDTETILQDLIIRLARLGQEA